jgi:PAT family beta-lactamase induction signal transducer AmpG
LSVARESVTAPPAAEGKASFRQILANPKMLVIMAMAAASGYPNQLTESALQAWLKDSHVTNTTIGLMSYVSLPYLLKFLWAPLLDRYPIPLLGRRRGWILVTQLALAAGIALLAVQDPTVALTPLAICAAVIVFLSATQDIGIDAYRSDVSLPAERGLAATATNLGYRTAAWFASAVALVIADYFGWRPAFLILAGVMTLCCISTWLAPEPPAIQQPPRSLK